MTTAPPTARAKTFLSSIVLLYLGVTQIPAATSGWTSKGPDGGTVRALAVNPANPAILYAGTAGGGIFRTADGGASWSAINNGLAYWTDGGGQSATYVNALAVNPVTPTTLYAGTRVGVFKSVDGGANWAPVSGTDAIALAIDPASPGTVYVGTTDYGIYKITPAGVDWSPANGPLAAGTVNAIAVNPVTATVYASSNGGGLFQSPDGGASWTRTGLGTSYVQTVAIDPVTPTTLYAAGYDLSCIYYGDYTYEYCYPVFSMSRSSDSGATWTRLAGMNDRAVNTVTIDPTNSSIAYAGTSVGVFKSTTSGASWSAVDATSALPSVYALAINPASTSVFAGTAGGVFKNTGSGWQTANTGLAATHIPALAIDPITPATIFAGTDTGVLKSTDGANTWSDVSNGLNGSYVVALTIDPRTPTTVYAATVGNSTVFKSADGGSSWRTILSFGYSNDGAIRALAVDPVTPTTLYAGTTRGVLKTTDGGGSWSEMNSGLTTTNVVNVAIDPLTPAIVFASTYADGVFKTTDGGVSWTHVFITPDGRYQRTAVPLAIDPQTPGTVYVATCCYDGTLGEGILKSTDGGISFRAVNAGLPHRDIRALSIDPRNPATLYAALYAHHGSAGIFRSVDGGGNWSAVNTGLTAFDVRSLVVAPSSPAVVYAGTAGGGVFVAPGDMPGNLAPHASFGSACAGLTCTYDGTSSSDPDGTITSYAWDFGDGQGGGGSNVSHTYASSGTYTVRLRVTDNGGATSALTKTVTVSQPALHVGDLDAAAAGGHSTWTTTVTITIHDAGEGLVGGAVVNGTWSDGTANSCTTNGGGQCLVSKGGISKKTTSVTFTMTGVARPGLAYDPGRNHDPEGDSGGTSIVIRRP